MKSKTDNMNKAIGIHAPVEERTKGRHSYILGSLTIWNGCVREEREGDTADCDFSIIQNNMQRYNQILPKLRAVFFLNHSVRSCVCVSFRRRLAHQQTFLCAVCSSCFGNLLGVIFGGGN